MCAGVQGGAVRAVHGVDGAHAGVASERESDDGGAYGESVDEGEGERRAVGAASVLEVRVRLSSIYLVSFVTFVSDIALPVVLGVVCRAKRKTRKEWDREWGRIGLEGNIWSLGSVRRHWELVFGPNPWTWMRALLFLYRLSVC